MNTKPGESEDLKLPIPQVQLQTNAEYILRVLFRLNKDFLWAPKGYLVAWQELPMPYQVPRDFVKPAIKGSVSLTETEHVITVIGKSFSAQVSKDDGLLHSLKYGEREMVITPLKPNFWRPLTDNDARTHTLIEENLIIWKSALEGMKVKDILVGGFGSKKVVVKAFPGITKSKQPPGFDLSIFPGWRSRDQF